jgi:hypothetical protein
MQDDTPAGRHAAPGHEAADPAAVRTDLATVWRLVAPWLGYLLLAAAGLLGLFTASDAGEGEGYAAGLLTFGLAVLIIAWRMRDQLDGRDVGLFLPVMVEGEDALLLWIAVMTALGIAGLLVAAGSESVLHTAGIALFVVAALFIFFAVKRNFDRRERGGPPG